MSVKLRLTRMGRKKRPFYRIVAIDSRVSRDGGYLEKIGTYNPLTDPADVQIDKELALKWLKYGAQPSETVRNFLRKEGILFELELHKRGLSAEETELEYKKWELEKQDRQKKAEAMAVMKRRDEEKKAAAAVKAKAKEQADAQADVEVKTESADVAEEAAKVESVSSEAGTEESVIETPAASAADDQPTEKDQAE
ncbi:30S ribosomal protein S16 [candidate division KSB1 bacterium]|nr:30S ribosomal protein S16 [candidate division KSB1 bacterium]